MTQLPHGSYSLLLESKVITNSDIHTYMLKSLYKVNYFCVL